jgi:hypothetical protein
LRLDKDRIKESLSSEDIRLILRDLGSAAPKQDSQGHEMYQTVCHNNYGGKHKLYYYPQSKSFHCYTDCGQSYDIFSLVEQVKKINFLEAVRYVGNLTGKLFTTTNQKQSHMIDDWSWIERYLPKKKVDITLPIHSEKILDVFLPIGHEEWEREGISLEVQRQFGISYYIKQDQIIIPCRNTEGQLIGLRARNLREEEIVAGKKYIPATVEHKLYSFPTMYNLYMLNKTQHSIKRFRKVVLWESEKSCLKTESIYGEDNFSCAVYGSNISKWQVNTLLSLGVEEVIIAFDKQFKDHESDEAYKWAETLKRITKKFTPYVKTFVIFDKWNVLNYKDSPIDKGKETLEFLMKNKIEVKTEGGE